MAFDVKTKTISISTKGEIEIIDLTPYLDSFIREVGLMSGTVTLFVPGSTAAITTIEYEPGCLHDLKKILRMLVPDKNDWHHDRIDNNARAHLRASLIGPSLTVPVENGHALLGTWQQPVFLELDVRPRNRRILLTAVGLFK